MIPSTLPSPQGAAHTGAMPRAFGIVWFVAILGACSSTSGEAPTDATPGGDVSTDATDDAPNDAATDGADAFIDDPPTVDRFYTEDTTTLLNPERGWMDGGGIGLVDGASYDSIRKNGFTLAYAKVRLDAYRTKDLDAAFLASLDAGFGRVRDAGIKVVLRFVYNDPSTYPSTDPDASLTQIQKHLTQLAPVLSKNVDVIAVMEAGFIGLWGEWHGSTNGLETPAARKAVLDAILAALPPSRRVLVRTPGYKMEQFPTPVEAKDVFGTSAQARIGHHDDCFLAGTDDEGTFTSDADRTYLEQDSTFLPVGGESCAPNPPRSECANAMLELARYHWSFYNPYWHPDVFAEWTSGGCKDEIQKKLGYRFVVDRLRYAPAVAPGSVLPLELDYRNTGWATLYNERIAKVVLDDGVTRWVADLAPYDVFHRVQGGTGALLMVRLRVPASAHPGKAKVELWLPDAAPALAGRPEYSVRFANQDTWDPTHGSNVLAETTIDPEAPGPVDPTAKDFVVLP